MSAELTLRETCVFAVAILGGQPTTKEILSFLVQDGWQVSRDTVRGTLSQIRGAAVEIAVQGEAGYGHPTRWRLTEAALAWLLEGECRCPALSARP